MLWVGGGGSNMHARPVQLQRNVLGIGWEGLNINRQEPEGITPLELHISFSKFLISDIDENRTELPLKKKGAGLTSWQHACHCIQRSDAAGTHLQLDQPPLHVLDNKAILGGTLALDWTCTQAEWQEKDREHSACPAWHFFTAATLWSHRCSSNSFSMFGWEMLFQQ